MKSYTALYDVHQGLYTTPINSVKAQVLTVLQTMQDFLACPRCGELIRHLNEDVFVNKCAHVYCKTCYALEDNNCQLCRR